MTRATLITDASFCARTGAGGWACWISGDGFRSKSYSGQFRTALSDNNLAELYAIVNGLYKASSLGCSRILVQTDSMAIVEAMNRVLEKGEKHKDFAKVIRREINAWRHRLEIKTIEFRHVKGHSSSSKGARFYCNNWCDTQAKREMNEMRKRLEQLKGTPK